MRQNGIKAKIKSKYRPQTTRADDKAAAYPNLLAQRFDEKEKKRVWLLSSSHKRK
jgi:hypothetical protein